MKSIPEILCDLIQIRTDPTVQDNFAMVGYITNYLRENGIIFELISNPDGKMNILTGINVRQLQDISGGIVLSGHMDTVGATPLDWETDPFQGIIRNGKIYGRGAMDMKHFIAVVLGLLPKLKQISIPIFLALTCDEETTVCGAERITQFLTDNHIKPDCALIGESTDFKLCVGNRGYAGYRTCIKGVTGHAGNPSFGTNATYLAAKIISKIEALNTAYMPQGTTLNVGIINGGIGRNSIPDYAAIDWEVRYQNRDVLEQINTEMNAFYQILLKDYSDARITVNMAETLPAFERQTVSRITQTAKDLLKTEEFEISYASEAGFYQALGMDTLMCGVGNPKLAHAVNEYIAVGDLEKYATFLVDLIKGIKV